MLSNIGPTRQDAWWLPKPLTQEQMEVEIAMSRIKGKPAEEFPPEAVHGVLKDLNLTDNNVSNSSSSSAG